MRECKKGQMRNIDKIHVVVWQKRGAPAREPCPPGQHGTWLGIGVKGSSVILRLFQYLLRVYFKSITLVFRRVEVVCDSIVWKPGTSRLTIGIVFYGQQERLTFQSWTLVTAKTCFRETTVVWVWDEFEDDECEEAKEVGPALWGHTRLILEVFLCGRGAP